MIPIFKSREDKLKPYIDSVLKDFMFTELDPDFLMSADMDFLIGTPVPIAKDDFSKFIDKGLSTLEIADNIAVVIGADTHFRHVDVYLQYLNRMFSDDLTIVLVGNGQDAFNNKEYKKGMAYFRAAMMFRFEKLQAMFCYAWGCRTWYLSMEGEEENEELIALLKSEAKTYFEHCTNAYPEFARSWYFLGYDYLNEGKYLKAQLAWKHFIAEADPAEDEEGCIPEINERLAALEDPVKIEAGVDALTRGDIEAGLAALEPYTQTKFNTWWPLHYYLGMAYREMGWDQEAKEGFLKVLELSPSNTDAMEALSELYAKEGDSEKAEKYMAKAAMVKKNIEEN